MDWKNEFIDFCIKKKALKFGFFKLKSGRISPYFFNSGVLSSGIEITKIGLLYAQSIINSKIEFDVLFGPAYKGIPIVVSTAMALKKDYYLNIPYAFNRKEYKKHGEKGDIIGNNIKNKKIIILDDVITSGKAIHYSIKTIEKNEAQISSIFVLLDRQEQGKRELSTINCLNDKKKYNITSIITIQDLINYLLKDNILKRYVPALIQYRKQYGIY
ncbi:orotate phosphoribosyltransferase [Buchnera aphidicola (Hyadaphis tataricae)]|uniref:Orotate phosphoribosyltransferase n=1 Tax=Buchnera aphidicola (Hyadaphis tataricae) TaxID=1241859 RepID=A0A4D6Y7H9_9GAMM|nr:orotate phosphoribosyltransferase [Buchnera aphidicola]QCI21830.1 orotate phosphoribosyltransferase [Buchnera aphidicola (Hyadaphis tataricae)]